MIRKRWILGVVVAFGLVFSGCASIINGTTQEVGFSSSPTGAKICVDNQQCGNTPRVFNLKRKENHIVRLELEGYQPYETTLSRQVSGWVWGNVLFGGLVGLAVDAISGGIYKLTPEQINGTLLTTQVSESIQEDRLMIAFVLTPDPKWEKIGQLEAMN